MATRVRRGEMESMQSRAAPKRTTASKVPVKPKPQSMRIAFISFVARAIRSPVLAPSK